MDELLAGLNVDRINKIREFQEPRVAYFLAQRTEQSREQTVGTLIAVARGLAVLYLAGLGYGSPTDAVVNQFAEAIINRMILERKAQGIERTEHVI